MANENANKDDNDVSTLLGVLKTDGTSTVRVKGNPTNGSLKISLNGGGSNTVAPIAQKDDNNVSSLLVVSSVDGTPIAVATDSSGNILMETV